MQRLRSTDRTSQQCIIAVGEPEGTVPSEVREEGGEEEGSSGSSGGLSNVVLSIENASIDPYAKDLQAITEGVKGESHEYYRLSTKTTYHKLIYDFNKYFSK